MQREVLLGGRFFSEITLLMIFPSITFSVSRHPNPQWGQAVSIRSLCQTLPLTGLRASVRAPTGHRETQSQQEMQSLSSVGAIRASKPLPSMSIAALPDTSRQA